MLRNWKWLGVATLLTVAMAVPGAARGQFDGAPPQDDRFKSLEKKMEDFEKKLIATLADAFKAVKDDMKDLRTNMNLKAEAANGRIAALELSLKQLKSDMERMRVDLEALRFSDKRISLYPSETRDQMAELQRQIADLKQTVQQSISKYPSSVGQPPVILDVINSGSLVVTNRRPETIVLTVNGIERARIAPNMQAVVRDVPLGTVTYGIISSFGETLRTSVIRSGCPLRVEVQ